eukprot:TRINITY_DN7851_c0_g1_i1.p1 TRINITY_DN7851_c0_g1~~TRINITY_DN7851_c0_g1_i1.p1  ORF type:complete len:474 (+),score=80.95 TRINITY_DN7851_c0_g1_i1:37-1422(+)
MSLLVLTAALVVVACVVIRIINEVRRSSLKTKTVGIFHPYCNDGGGGERVLWRIVDVYQKHSKFKIVVYSGDLSTTPEKILEKAKDQFGIQLDKVEFIFLKTRFLVEAKRWPYFTMLGQSIGSMIMGLEALLLYCPHIFLDTMGYSFTYPLFALLGGCKVAAYVHYPTISSDMLQKVSGKKADFNNNSDVSKSTFKTNAKLIYYHIFALLYQITGQFCSLTLVNSSWTRDHIVQRWKKFIGSPREVHLVYPPVDCSNLRKFPLTNRKPYIVSIGQFRKEKNHLLQLESFNYLLKNCSVDNKKDLKLVMIGSVRVGNNGDEKRLKKLKDRAEELGIQDQVIIGKGLPGDAKYEWLKQSSIGLHTMSHEHFGIGIVELMSAGIIPVAHNSGGPKADIVTNYNGGRTGFLAIEIEEYAKAIEYILNHPKEASEIRKNSRESVEKFSDESFSGQVVKLFKKSQIL